jgi:NADH-quinone oxidoreductase subunit K
MLNAANINLVAFWRHLRPDVMSGQVFTLMVFVVAAAEAAVGLALCIAIYSSRGTVVVEDMDLLKG